MDRVVGEEQAQQSMDHAADLTTFKMYYDLGGQELDIFGIATGGKLYVTSTMEATSHAAQRIERRSIDRRIFERSGTPSRDTLLPLPSFNWKTLHPRQSFAVYICLCGYVFRFVACYHRFILPIGYRIVTKLPEFSPYLVDCLYALPYLVTSLCGLYVDVLSSFCLPYLD